MNIKIFNKEVLERYHSKSQIARILTEQWFENEMYCPNCMHDDLVKNPNNTKITDFVCDYCENSFQLKSQSKPFSSRVVDGAFTPLVNSVMLRTNPHFSFLQYSSEDWNVKNLFVVPSFFFSKTILEKRKALSSSARRAGWVGCNILLSRLPDLGKIKVIDNEKPLPKRLVQKSWKNLVFMNEESPGRRGWIVDVMFCIQQLQKTEFSLSDLYEFEEYLADLHPDNANIKPKIRQQLQV